MKLLISSVTIALFAIHTYLQQGTDVLKVSENLKLIRLNDGAFIHESITESKWGRVSSNGLVLIRNKQAFLFDTPMDEPCTKELVAFIQDSLQAAVIGFVPNHWHVDCLGGLAYLHSKGVKSYANNLTIKLAGENGYEVPQHGFNDSLKLTLGSMDIFCYYPGAAHAMDNIVVWIPEQKILFAGCMVKEINAKTMGNTADADLKAWPVTIQNVINKYPEAEIIIPGHGPYGGKELLFHTLELTGANNK